MDLTIYTYGYSEIILNVLNALAMFRNHNFYVMIISTLGMISGLFYSISISSAISVDEMKSHIRRVGGMVLLIEALLLPTTSMNIQDNVTKDFHRVDNIPLAFAVPIGAIESFGHILTIGFEQTFTAVGSASAHSFYHHGTIFGARLKQDLLRAKVEDPEFVSNMDNFIERCVMLPSMIGYQFTKEELAASKDIWAVVSEKAGTFAKVALTIDGKRVYPYPSCKAAVPYFEKKFAEATSKSVTSWLWKYKGAGNSDKKVGTAALNNALKTQIKTVFNVDNSVDKTIRHLMMINSLKKWASNNYSATKAIMQKEAGGLISKDMAEKLLTESLAIMKALVYSSFVFLLPSLIITGGFARYKGWLVVAFSLALWPSLFSIINMIIDYGYESGKIVSLSSWSSEVKKFDSIVSTAGAMSLMIPFLALWLIKQGEGGFIQMAGALMSTAQSATGAIASERASGTKSWDNTSIGNQSYNNTNANKHDTSMQYVDAGVSTRLADGTTQQITPGGKLLHFGGAGTTSSTGETNYQTMDGQSAHHQKAMSNEMQAMQSDVATRSKAQERLSEQTASIMHDIHQGTRTENGYNIDTSTEQGKELHHHMSEVDRLNKSNNYGWEQNARAYIDAHAGYKIPGLLGKLTGANGGIKMGGESSAGNSSSQSDS